MLTGKVTNIDRFIVQVPIIDRVRLDMERAGIHTWGTLEVIRVDTDSGHVGWGETVVEYSWGSVKDHDRVLGRSPFEVMWDDSLGPGLQMALFDVAGKLAEVPAYRLIGNKCRDWCPISFWDHDMSPERYEAEAKVAVELGYTSMKIKTRPWFDVPETMRRISHTTPDHFRIDADWNEFLNNASNAIPLLNELENTFPKIKIFEDPIARNDSSGNRYLRTQIKSALAHHFGYAGFREGLELGGVCDGWVITGGVSQTVREANASAQVNMPFFLQLVGSGLTTTMALHLGAVLRHCQWPAITCYELFEHPLIEKRHPIVEGHARVPEEPGLGIKPNEDVLEKYRVDKPDHRLPRRLIKVIRQGGVNVYFANTKQKWTFFHGGNLPVDEWGGRTELLDDDGSSEFDKLYQRAVASPVLTEE